MNVTYRLHALGALMSAIVSCAPAEPPVAPTIEPWPFMVEAVTLSCEPAPIPPGADEAARRILRERGARIFVTTDEGHRYAVNGSARGEAPLMRDILATTDTTDLVQRGLSLCGEDQGRSERLVRTPLPLTPRTEVPAPPTYTFRASELGHGYFATAQADQVVHGKRPELTLACERGHKPMVMLDLVDGPRTPPPLRGVYASFRVGAGPSQQFEMSWASGEDWTLRGGDERSEDTALVRQILDNGRVTFKGASDYMPASSMSWDFNGFGDDLALIRRECSEFG